VIDYQRVRELLDYNPLTGDLIWLQDGYRRARRKKGEIAGSLKKNKRGSNRRQINIDRVVYRSTRIIWLWMTGDFPPPRLEIDHINRDALDDRWENLRLVDKQLNGLNRMKSKGDYTSVYKGVHRDDKYTLPFCATLVLQGIKKILGRFDSEIDAARAYDRALLEFFPTCTALNFPKETYKL